MDLAALLEAEISRGGFVVGAAIPSETDLRLRFGVGRHVVREAIGRLEQAGFVRKRQGAATRVIALQPRSRYVHSLRSLSEVIQFAREAQLQILDQAMVAVAGADAELVHAGPGARWLRIRGIRRETERGDVIGYATVFAHARFAPVLAGLTEPNGPLYAIIEAQTGEFVQEARQIIAAGALPSDAARQLGLGAGHTAIKVTRRYFDLSGGVMLASLNWHDAATFSYAATLRRDMSG
jgi:GntR family transcriptional regulator